MIRQSHLCYLPLLFHALSFSQHTFAEPDDAEYPTRDARSKSQYFVGLNYSHLDLLLPAKKGFHLGFVSSSEQSYEI